MQLQLLLCLSSLLGASTARSTSPYVPYEVECPSEDVNFLRTAKSLGDSEAAWLQGRDRITRDRLREWLVHSNLSDFNAESFLSNSTIRIGLAFSGGGFRAMLSGAGQLAALDSRTNNSDQPGHLGGLFQASTYLAGLSGGNWLVGSIAVNNFTSVQSLQNSKHVWNLEHSLANPGGVNIFKTFGYYGKVVSDVREKKEAGWNTSLTDLWGRALSYKLLNFTDGGSGVHYSYVRDYPAFTNYEVPFPIHVSDGRSPGEVIIDLNSTVYEITPFHIGSWDPDIYAFSDLKWMGSQVRNGNPDNSSQCVNGYDNAGFIMATSATLFNQFILQLNKTSYGKDLKDFAAEILLDLADDSDDISVIAPNPFYRSEVTSNNVATHPDLTLVDGGEDGQNIPLHPLIQPQREVDIVFAFDNSADTKENFSLGGSWPNGKSLQSTYERQFGDLGNNTIFPYVPDNVTFYYGGWSQQPTFFGCNRDNLTSLFNETLPEEERYYPPLIVYMPNSLHSFESNTSTFKLAYSTKEVAGIIENGYNQATQNNGTIDSEWRSCIACAIILREQQRRGEEPTDQCRQCFDHYCWDGSYAEPSDEPPKRHDGRSNLVAQASKIHKESSEATSNGVHSPNGAISLEVGGAWTLLALFSVALSIV